MTTTAIILTLLFLALAFSSRASYRRARRLKKLRKLSTEFRAKQGIMSNATENKALHIPDYYKNITGKEEVKNNYKWELHESF